jgi:hypothetical protein
MCTTGTNYHAIIHTYTSVTLCTVCSCTSPWESRPLLTWRPPAMSRVVLFGPRLLVNCPLVPHCSPLFPASLPPGFPQNPNVLLIRTHPNPFPSVANKEYTIFPIFCFPGRRTLKQTWLWKRKQTWTLTWHRHGHWSIWANPLAACQWPVDIYFSH